MQSRIFLIVSMGLLLLAIACGRESTPLPTPLPLTSAEVQEIVTDALQSIETPDAITAEQVEQIVADALGDAPQDLTEEVQDMISVALANAEMPDSLTVEEVQEIVSQAIANTLPDEVPQTGGSALPVGPQPLDQEGMVGMLFEPGEDCGDPVEPLQGTGRGTLAAEITGIEAWVNSEALCLSDLRGRVVLVDFWTYTCVNCIRTFPYLREWHARYAGDGLVILGIHTPEFEFEEDRDNVRNASVEDSIVWPVALDNDYGTWRAYNNRYWPAKYLIDKDGIIRYTHFGEGAYAETENEIRKLLEEAGADLTLDIELPTDQIRDPAARTQTRELYGGYGRGCRFQYVFDVTEFCASKDEIRDYEDPGSDHEDDLIYLQGPWRAGEESLQYAPEGSSGSYDDYLLLKFTARTANAVLTPEEGGEPFKVLVTLDGQPLTEEDKGRDVVIEDGRSYLMVDEPTLYSIVDADAYGTYVLKMSSESPHFALFAFTFGTYTSGI